VRALILGLALAGGCQFDPSDVLGSGGGSPDAGPLPGADGAGGGEDGAPGSPDGAAAPDAPGPLGDFGAPVPVPALSSPFEDDDPTLTGDLLEMYFDSSRSGNNDIWVSQRDQATDPWGSPERVAELSSTSADGEPEVAADGLTIWIASLRPGGGGGSWDIWVATRGSRDAPWSDPVAVTDLNSTGTDFHASLTADGLYLIMNSDRNPALGYDNWACTREAVGNAWGALALVSELNTSGQDSNTHLQPDGLLVVIDSDRPGTLGSRDLYLATRPSRAAIFSTPEPIAVVNGGGRDSDPWISSDLRTLVFASDRSGNMEIYESTR
jgi:Tol biopolymer transport system component